MAPSNTQGTTPPGVKFRLYVLLYREGGQALMTKKNGGLGNDVDEIYFVPLTQSIALGVGTPPPVVEENHLHKEGAFPPERG